MQSDAHAHSGVARGPLLLTSRLAPILNRSGLRRSLGPKAFAVGRRGSINVIRAAAEPEGSICAYSVACCHVDDLDAYKDWS